MDIPLPGELSLPDIPFPDSIPLPPASIPPPVPDEDAPPLPPPPSDTYNSGGVSYTPQPPPAPMDSVNAANFPQKKLSPIKSNGANVSSLGSPIKEYPPVNKTPEFSPSMSPMAAAGKGGLLGPSAGKGGLLGPSTGKGKNIFVSLK